MLIRFACFTRRFPERFASKFPRRVVKQCGVRRRSEGGRERERGRWNCRKKPLDVYYRDGRENQRKRKKRKKERGKPKPSTYCLNVSNYRVCFSGERAVECLLRLIVRTDANGRREKERERGKEREKRREKKE